MRIEEKIELAKAIYDEYGEVLKSKYCEILRRLDQAIGRTWDYMRSTGITEICRRCAIETGSCCWRWIEDLYDVETLLINLLLNVELPRERYRENLCLFCGENGCKLRAREGICVTYLCERIDVDRIEFNSVCSVELGLMSLLKVRIRRFLDQRVPRSSSYIGFWRSHHPQALSFGRYTVFDDEGRSTLR